jgi:hypothetical protein
MTVASWPSGLPFKPAADTWKVQSRYQAPTRTEMEDGPVRQRRSNTARWTKIPYQIQMTAQEFETADNFIVNTLGDGTARFMMPIGRPYTPDPWPSKMCFIDAETWSATAFGVNDLLVSFTINVLDW